MEYAQVEWAADVPFKMNGVPWATICEASAVLRESGLERRELLR